MRQTLKNLLQSGVQREGHHSETMDVFVLANCELKRSHKLIKMSQETPRTELIAYGNIISLLDNMGALEFSNYLLVIINECQTKKDEMINLKRKLRNRKVDAVAQQDKYRTDKILWCTVSCASLVAGGVAAAIPGVNLIVAGAVLITNVAAIGGNMKCDRDNNREVLKIVSKVNNLSDNLKSTAMIVSERKEEFIRERIRLIEAGISEEYATLVLIIAMLRNKTRFKSTLPAQTKRPHIKYQAPFTSSFTVATALQSAKKYGLYAFEKAPKLIKVSPEFMGGVAAGLAVLGVAFSIYDCANACLKTSPAIVVIDEMVDVLTSGQESLDYFIGLLNTIRITINQQEIINSRMEMRAEIESIRQEVRESMHDLHLEFSGFRREVRDGNRRQDDTSQRILDTLSRLDRI
ncbi:unnamed protein product [Oppiella nova]|uniref:Uncharacterized protein n=1 Tax=Oppiella nova TaxID=334625 RepID=A0A7R9MD62_9ACAR|nr:unnamed protein product [Oppiella nova]CAG2175118.1 unnamed protein product [Oppiella nova]